MRDIDRVADDRVTASTVAEVVSTGRDPLSIVDLQLAIGRTLRGAELVFGGPAGAVWTRSGGNAVQVAAEEPTVIVRSIPFRESFSAVFAGQKVTIDVDIVGATSREVVVRVEVGTSSSLDRVVGSLLPVLGELLVREWAPTTCDARLVNAPGDAPQRQWHWQRSDRAVGVLGERRIDGIDSTVRGAGDPGDSAEAPCDHPLGAAVSSALVTYFGRGETKTPSPSARRIRRDHVDWDDLLPAVEAIIRSSISVSFLADGDLAASTRRAADAYRTAFPDLNDEAIGSLAWAWAWENR